MESKGLDLTLCQSRLHAASEMFVRHKKIRIRFDFLRFRTSKKHFSRYLKKG